MLRAGKLIEIDKDELVSENGILIAPIINLCGLVLRADKPIPETIAFFLKNEGVEVHRMRYKEELFIRINGVYTLRKNRIEAFMAENLGLVEAQLQNLEEIPESKVIADEVDRKINMIGQTRCYVHEATQYDCLHASKSDSIRFNMNSVLFNLGHLGSNTHILIRTPRLINQGMIIGKLGLFAESSAKEDHVISTQYGFQDNGFVDTGKSLKIKALDATDHSQERLYINQSKQWLNHPHANTTDDLSATVDERAMASVI